MKSEELTQMLEGISGFSFDETKTIIINDTVSKIYINGTQNVKWVLFDHEMKIRAYGEDNQVKVGILKEGFYKMLITYENGCQKAMNVRKVII